MQPDDPLTALLAAPPRCPTDPDLFSSNPRFGEPGIYPQGRPMVPAAGPATSEADARGALEAVGIPDAAARLADPALCARAPEPGPWFGVVSVRAAR